MKLFANRYWILSLLLLPLYLPTAMAQQQVSKDIVKPILLDPIALSGLDLKPVKSSWDPERKLFQSNLYVGREIGVFVVSSETATANWESYGIEEFIYVINGRARLDPTDNEERLYRTGDFFVAPKGYSGDWETQGASEYYHELSVIAMGEKKATIDSTNLLPYLIDKDKLSGIGMTAVQTAEETEAYRDVLFDGAELEIVLEAEVGQKKKIVTPWAEQLIYVIAGSVKMTPKEGEATTFYAGDFFVLPAGFVGDWESRGHQLFRYLSVKKST